MGSLNVDPSRFIETTRDKFADCDPLFLETRTKRITQIKKTCNELKLMQNQQKSAAGSIREKLSKRNKQKIFSFDQLAKTVGKTCGVRSREEKERLGERECPK